MDQLQIKDLEIFAYHGLFPSEKELGQPRYDSSRRRPRRLTQEIKDKIGFCLMFVMMLMNVDFPSPFAPTRPICSPFNKRNDTSVKIALSPNP